MRPTRRTLLAGVLFLAVITFAAWVGLGAGSAMAQIKFLGDGATQNTASGGWDLPAQGTCPAGTANGYSGIDTRPECVALRLNIAQGSCTGTNLSWTTSGVCNDLIHTTPSSCADTPDRLWNSGTSVCSIVMMDDDRNNLMCAVHGGTWVTAGTCTGAWVMPSRTDYTPTLLTGNGPGDSCLRCHNSITQYNGPRVRDTEDTLYMGHKNMARKVTSPMPWGGPPFQCSNPLYLTQEECEAHGGTWDPTIYLSDDSGNMFNWTAGTISVGGNNRDLTWIYGDWLSPLPRAIYKAPASTSKTCTDPRYSNQTDCEAHSASWVFNAGASYSCGRCHTTGWTSDATLQTSKEPEASFPSITWDRNSNAPSNVVNLSGGVTGSPNQYSSWDQYGIQCTRCHNSVVDMNLVACTGLTQATCNTLGGTWSSSTSTCSNITPSQCTGNSGTIANYVAPAGRSSHHNNLTAVDNSSGACTDTQYTAETQCTAAGGSWLTACSTNPTAAVCTQAVTTSTACASPGVWVSAPGWCSNAFYTTSATCTANGFTWQDGWCKRPDKDSTTCTGGSGSNALTWRLNGTQASCQIAGATWSFSECDTEGYCNKGTNVTTKAGCDALGGQFAYATDVIRCEDAGGEWTGSSPNRGPIITSLCMQCHRQETGGLPYGATSTDGINIDYSGTDPAGQLKVGPAHSSVGFVSHPAGNLFLNSPHGKFTGRFDQIATSKFGAGYASQFQNAGETANTGNGCTGCHEVHTSTVAGKEPFRAECTECHADINLTAIAHNPGPGTPLELPGAKACEKCHMPGGLHLWRINTSASYSTYPMPAAMGTTPVNANTAPDGSYTSAVWADLDAACGQCHGGGTGQASTTGTISASSDALTVASSTGFAVGQRIVVAGAGALYYDELGQPHRENFPTYVKAIPNGTTITLAGKATGAVTNASCKQNPTTPLAPYYPKSYLATVAQGMHDLAGITYPVTFSAAVVPNSLTVNVTASVGCGGSCPTFVYEWNWGDGSSQETTVPNATHTYPTAGTKSIGLTVRLATNHKSVGSVTRSVTIPNPDLPPVVGMVGGTCSWNDNTWVMTLTDSSVDDGPDGDMLPGDGNSTLRISVDWGDLTTKSFGSQGGSFSHTYTKTGTFTVTHTATDSRNQTGSEMCGPATPHYFTISGTVRNHAGAPLAGAAVTVKIGTTVVKTVTTASNGTFTTGATMKPASYTLTVTKSGYTFPVTGPQAVGPDWTGIIITANN